MAYAPLRYVQLSAGIFSQQQEYNRATAPTTGQTAAGGRSRKNESVAPYQDSAALKAPILWQQQPPPAPQDRSMSPQQAKASAAQEPTADNECSRKSAYRCAAESKEPNIPEPPHKYKGRESGFAPPAAQKPDS